jgi:hypothetical protein
MAKNSFIGSPQTIYKDFSWLDQNLYQIPLLNYGLLQFSWIGEIFLSSYGVLSATSFFKIKTAL